jgi:photosystem II stability/assembly factor-like uncharacterized protein
MLQSLSALSATRVIDGVEMSIRKFSPRASPADGYQGVIAKTLNGGHNWTPVLNITGQGLYFNEIFCVDANTCWYAHCSTLTRFYRCKLTVAVLGDVL